MGKISTARWLRGGIIAGLLINISEAVLHVVILKKPWESAMGSLGRAATMSPTAMLVWAAWGFAYGLLCVWVYAAIRPRFGPGAGTAVKAGLAAWLLSGLLPSVTMGNIGLLPASLLLITGVWTLVESVVVTIAGAWIYREEQEA